jgi:DNA-binding transcriptional ArsR family regulator
MRKYAYNFSVTKTPLADVCRAALARHLRPELFQSLCDPQRLALICRLAVAPAPMTVTEAGNCCDVHISGVSRHLSLLKRAGVVVAQRRGREVAYQLDARPLVDTLRGLADAIEDCCQTNQCCTPRTRRKP